MIRIRFLFFLVDLGQRMIEPLGGLHPLGRCLCENRPLLSRCDLPAGLAQPLVKLETLLLLFGDTRLLLLEGLLRLGALFLETLLHQRDACVLDTLASLRLEIDEVLRERVHIGCTVLRRRNEPADIEILTDIGDLIHQVLRLVQISLALFLSRSDRFLFQPYSVGRVFISLIIGKESVYFSAVAPPRIIIRFRFRLGLLHPLVSLGRFVDKALYFGLKKEHLNVSGTFLKQRVVPFADGVVVAEALAVFPVELIDFRFFLFFGTIEFSQTFQGRVDFESGFDHLRPTLLFDFHPLFGFGRSLRL